MTDELEMIAAQGLVLDAGETDGRSVEIKIGQLSA